MANKKDRISQLANRLQSSEKKEDNVSASSSSSSSIKTSGQTRYDRIGQLADVLTRWGYETKAPSPKTEDELFIGSSERASQMPTYEVPEQKPRFVLPSNTPRTTKNSPTTTTTSNSIWGSSNFRSGAKMPTFDSKKLTARDVSESVGNSAFQGVFGELAHSLYGVAAGAENIFEKYLLGYDDPEELSGIFQSLRDLQAKDYDTRQEQIANTSAKSPVMEVVNNLVPDTARNVRDLLLSMATGGAWAGVKASSAAENLSRQILTASQGIGAQATQYISDVMRNPQFYSVLAETIGGSYTDALSKGATEEQALISSALSAIPNALIEVGGGTEDVVRAIGSKQFKSGLQGAIDIGKSALEEAGEEILQDVVSGVIEKGTWDYDRPMFTGEFDAENDAVYNLARMLESAGYAIAGTVLTAGAGSAIQRGTSRILTDADRVSAGSEIKKADGGNQLLKIAATSESQEVQNQRSEIMSKLRKGQNVSAYSLGKLAESISNDATINLVESTKRVQTADNTQNVIRDNTPISNQSSEGISAIDAEIRRYTTPFVQNAPQEREMSTNVGKDLIEDYASRLGESGAKAFRQIAENSDSNTFQRMRNAFQAYYNYGNWGKKIEDVSTAFSDSISSDQAYQAFTAGQNDAASSLQADTAAAVPASAKGGLVSSRAASMVDKNTRLYLDGIGRELGVQIEIESGERDAQGNLLSNGRMVDGKIYISASSKKPIASVLNHELTHVLQERSPDQYRAYKNFVASYLDSQNSGWFESQVQRMIDGYDSIGESISREMAEDEVVSDAAERFLSDETAVKELVKENRSVAQKVLDAIRDIIRKLANIVRGDNDAESTASRILREQEEVFRQAEKMWAKALAESAPTTPKNSKRNKNPNSEFSQKERSAKNLRNTGVRRQLNLDNWRDAMTDEESKRYYQLQAKLDTILTDISQTSKKIKAIRDSEEYKSFVEMKKASGQMRGRFAKFSAEDIEDHPFLKELTDLIAYNSALRNRSNELYEEQYPIELKAKERLRKSEENKVLPSYSENSVEAAERREKALTEFGTTRSWGETGYILKGGEQLNFRGGSTRGSRSVDHREVNQFFDEDDMSPSEAMVAFIKEGNIRVMPEVPGITVAMGTTISDAQEKALGRYISSKGNEIFLVDIINDNGDNLDTLAYERNVKLDKVLRDIRYFLENGEKPEESVTAMFHSRYQLALDDDDVYEFTHAQPDVDYQLEGRDDDPGTYRSREQDIEAIGLDTGWLDRHVSNAISMDESGTLEDRIETLKKESEVLKNVSISDDQLKKIAGRVLKEYDSRLDENQFAEAVKSAVDHIGRRGAKGYEQAFVSIYDEMVRALEQSESLDKSLWDSPDVKEIRNRIRGTRLYVSDDQKRDFQNFAEYKRDHREFKLVNDPTAMPVDQFYSELSSMYPGYFDAEKMTARDELDEISEWLGAVKPTVVNWYEGNIEQVSAEATADIIHTVNQIKSRKPEAKLTRQMIAQQERFEKRYQQLKERYLKNLQKADERLTLEKERRALDRAKAIEKIQQLKAHNREVKKRASDRRAISQSRKKIERIVDKLSRKLLKPTDTQNVPVELRGAVSRFLQAIDFRSYRAGEVSDTQKTQRWQDLQNILARISREEDSDGFDGMYFTVDPDMERRMRELMQSGVPVNLSNISREQIEELEKLIRAVDHMVRFVGKIRVEGQMMEATETARQIIDENSGKIKGTTRTTPIALRAKQFFQYDLLDPTRFSDMFGKGFYKIIHNLRMAENDKIRYWSQTESAFEQMLKDNGFTKKSVQKMGEDYRDVIIGGKIGKMSTAQIMSLYLANKREQGRSHLYGGGIALPDSTGRVITRHQKAYQLTEEDVSTITGMLSDSQRRLADAMQRFLSDDVAAWGNRMSRYLYGYDKFTEKNYWPILSDPNYTRSEVSLQQSEAKSATIKNLGMTKALVEKASNPIVIDSAFQVFAKHATQMAAYGAYVGPLEDLNKVMNWQTRHDGNWRSVRETISAAGGREAIRYLYKLIDDVNGQSRSEGDPYSGLMGAAKAASVAGNLRVVVQQPTAYWRAMAVIPPQYLVKGIAGKRVNVEEMLDTAPVAQWKSWGYFRDGVSGSNLLELMQGKTGVREKFVDWSMSLAGKADDMTWRQIYRAVESWVSGTTDLERGSEAFRQEVGKRFTEVVDRTQVVDSVFQRTQAMRNTGFGWKLATSFMAEPLKSYNLLVGSARNFVNAGKGEKGEALRKMLMAALGFAVSSVINAAVQSAWDVGRDKDPDEKIVEKFMQAMFGDTANDVKKEGGSWYDFAMAAVDGNLAGNFNPMSMIPVLNDIWSMLEGFDPEVMGLSAISDILSSGQTLYKSVSEGSGKYTAGYNAVQFIRKLSAATGLPIGNIYRELESLVNFTVTAAGDWLGMNVERLKFEINKLYLNPDQNRNIYYQSILDARAADDDSLAAEIANYLLSKGVKRSSIETGLANLISNDETNADLISEYAQAYKMRDMDEMSRLEEEGQKFGLSGLDLQKAAERYLKDLEPDSEESEPEEEFSEQDFEASAEYDTGYTLDVLTDAIVNGDSNTEQQMRSQLESSGKTSEDIDKSIKSELKSRMAENAGFDNVSQMQEAGEEFDTTSKEYQILHDKYGFTQYGYSDLYEALVDGRGYEAIYDDMLGQTSSGDNTYSAEGIEKEMKSRLQEDFNSRYKGGTGTGWEFYMNKLKEYGKTWDEILTSWKRSKAGQEWNDSN